MSGTLLDLDAPFVRAVLAILDRGASVDEAVDILIAAENRHGVRIVREDATGSLAVTWALADPRRPPTLRQFRELMAIHQHDDVERGVRSDGGPVWLDPRWDAWFQAGTDEDTPDPPLFGLLSETSLLLCGADFANEHWIGFASGAIASWSQRAWGEQLARWAHATRWRPDRARLWTGSMGYAFFTYDLHAEIDRYDAWRRTALKVIRRKGERQLDEPVA
jgi:hypothetical protein